MKVVIRCVNCQQIKRRSYAFHVKLQAKRNESSMLEKPDWKDISEKTWLCKECGNNAGYKVKEYEKLN